MSSTNHSYKCVLLSCDGGTITSGHTPSFFDEALNNYAAAGWRFVQAIRMDDLRFTLIFERMDG